MLGALRVLDGHVTPAIAEDTVMNETLQFVAAAVVGLFAGTHAAIWGMYKDSLHEGFASGRFLRSVVAGAAAAVTIHAVVHLALPSLGAIALLFGLSYSLERTAIELWKTFLRREDQSKYFIPMQFSIRGVPVQHPALRVVGALTCMLVIWGTLVLARAIGALFAAGMARGALVGLVAGCVVAAGGCWKDASTEGFDLVKFFRSPAIAVIYAANLSLLTSDPALIAAAAIGFERATVETYKKFFFPLKPPGKFAGKPVTHPQMLVVRRYFVPVYVTISAAAAGVLALAMTQ